MSNETLTIADWMRRAPKPVAERFDPERHVTLADLYDLAQDEINRAEDGLVKHHPSTMKSLRRFADDLHAAGALEQGNGSETGEYPEDWATDENEPFNPVLVAAADPVEIEPIAATAPVTVSEISNQPVPLIENESPVEPIEPVAPVIPVAATAELDSESSDEGRRSARAAAYRNQVRARLKVDFPNLALRRAEMSDALLRPLNRKFTKWADESGSEMALSLETVLEQIGAASERTIDEFTAAFLVQTA